MLFTDSSDDEYEGEEPGKDELKKNLIAAIRIEKQNHLLYLAFVVIMSLCVSLFNPSWGYFLVFLSLIYCCYYYYKNRKKTKPI